MTDWDVYLVTQSSLSGERSTPEVVQRAIDGGVDVVQLREKDVAARERYEIGQEVRELTREAGVPLIVNDRLDLALALDADGVHLGETDLPVAVARDLLGEAAIVGRSVSFVEDARAAERAGVDYLGVGAIYATGSKDDIDDDEYAIGTDRLADIVAAVDIPVVGIGGVTSENAARVIEAGADGVAVITEITGADDPAAATRTLARVVAEAR
ncbi:Thiamine-phosphate synthase protein [Halorhabdus tiamatea SARL4B]|uniref:Thiamine-phosphate synthase n=1 Tax=Halorhabdus tiamatea SARL4B TaxID=1033806 RepID=F7PNR1_9EURY|nr:thiamine phosphate synthase [Halorhabdus tiamatea]ERJ06780.1 Thiamine-phosphate synthase protein [Halorhabdus tiamatea SARL4B]CCQ33703.1 thiamine-phosphate pyrophosphorylase [Halorhabdus tiamatea SARL4B]